MELVISLVLIFILEKLDFCRFLSINYKANWSINYSIIIFGYSFFLEEYEHLVKRRCLKRHLLLFYSFCEFITVFIFKL